MSNCVFITGGTGLVGSHLIAEILQKTDWQVKALCRPKASLQNTESTIERMNLTSAYNSRVAWVKGDILDIFSLLDGMNDCHTVFHTAAIVSFDHRESDAMMETNVLGTANVVNACMAKGINDLVYTSSTAAIGKQKKQPITEHMEWNPDVGNSPYSKSKHLAELEVWRGMEEGLNVYIANPAVIIGPGDWKKSSARLFKQIAEGLSYYSPGSNAFVDVRDVATSLLALVEKGVKNERVLLAGANKPFKEMVEQVADALGVKRPSKKAPRWLASILWRLEYVRSILFQSKPLITKYSVRSAYGHATYDASKAEKTLGLVFRPLEEMVTFTAKAYLSQRP